MKFQIWFWQLIVSPHMAGLARALAAKGHEVVYVAAQEMSPDRAAQGWQLPSLGSALLHVAPTLKAALLLAGSSSGDAIHICQGVRGNGHISQVQKELARLGRQQWIVMETVDDSGWRGVIKRIVYRRLFFHMNKHLQGVLATGHQTPAWVEARGIPSDKVFPFAYFLTNDEPWETSNLPLSLSQGRPYRFLFVGQFVELKRLDLLVDAITALDDKNIELVVVGSGPLEKELRDRADRQLRGRVDWVGRLPMDEAHQEMVKADCLVLPSRYDGWGAVASEALMVGTPVICSDRCGAAEAVYASGVGGVFRSGDKASLIIELKKAFESGRQTLAQRRKVAGWAKSLGAVEGANYFSQILRYTNSGDLRPLPPWKSVSVAQ